MSINADEHGEPYSRTDAHTGPDITHPGAPPSLPNEIQNGSLAAARLLEITARDTDRWRSEAQTESDAIVAEARKESAEIVRTARDEAERLVATARDEAAQTTDDARFEAYRMREETSALRKGYDEEIARLEEIATANRARLRQHLTEMLDRVEAAPGESSH
jgi:cell division septum initiation protein DivIVA